MKGLTRQAYQMGGEGYLLELSKESVTWWRAGGRHATISEIVGINTAGAMSVLLTSGIPREICYYIIHLMGLVENTDDSL